MKPILPVCLVFLIWTSGAFPAGSPPKFRPEPALKQLMEGNRRFAAATPDGPHRSVSRLQEVRPGQEPFAAILGCADSRVPPEIIFDQGIGNLFVVRNAGNVEDDLVLGTLEYAAEHVHVPLILVLGHERCGAVAAAVKGGHHDDHIADVVKAIAPAVEAAREHDHDDVEEVTRANARLVAKRLSEKSKVLEKRIRSGDLLIQPAYYDLDTGRVTLLAEP